MRAFVRAFARVRAILLRRRDEEERVDLSNGMHASRPGRLGITSASPVLTHPSIAGDHGLLYYSKESPRSVLLSSRTGER